jgi:hypothetical protein
MQSVGSLDVAPALKATDVLAEAEHNADCGLNHVMRGNPKVTGKPSVINGVQVTTYTIAPGAWRDAEFEVL